MIVVKVLAGVVLLAVGAVVALFIGILGLLALSSYDEGDGDDDDYL